MQALPNHLKKYIVQQNYEKYTPIDQAVWRYVLRQLKNFLGEHAHKSYLSGLEKTGIDIEQIPHIDKMSEKLEKFGWRALPVSGFIPPAAFMELQSLSVLPIASDMRSIGHLMYTPAPDIVHEAAGHAPFLADEEYADYLKQYAQVAKKAIISKQDLDQYEAIRILSDVKENPKSTSTEITQAEKKLKEVSEKISFISEASELSRMNWWTAEYGLVGELNAAKIFGAGLLSSVGESKWCLSEKVKKIPLTVECVKQTYDITEPQPQLFVAKDFNHLCTVLNDLAETMAFKTGGTKALDKLIQAETVNTAQFENGIQISGLLKKYFLSPDQKSVAYLQFEGPTQLCYNDQEITGHSSQYHQHGYGTPIGPINNLNINDLIENREYELKYESGVVVKGLLVKTLKVSEKAIILSFENASCEYKYNNQLHILFKPEWGTYDIVIANTVVSGFGGPADREAYGEVEDFVAARVEQPIYTNAQKNIFALYQSIRDFRQSQSASEEVFKNLFLKCSKELPTEWLLFVELVEIGYKHKFNTDFVKLIEFHLQKISAQDENTKTLISEGLALAQEVI